MRVYIAAPYSMKDTIKQDADDLLKYNITCTSSWVLEPHKPTTQMQDLTHETHQKYALQDVEDVLQADVLVFHTDPTKTIVRGGRHVEFGMAVMMNRLGSSTPIYCVGMEEENIFHHLPQVKHFATWADVLQQIVNDQVDFINNLPF
jgi:nucleoside 2-deoxyribosyltransferase